MERILNARGLPDEIKRSLLNDLQRAHTVKTFLYCLASRFFFLRSIVIVMLFRLLLVTLTTHACLAAWVDTAQSVVKADGNLNPDNTHLAGWLNPEALVNLGDSQLLDGSSYSWTPAKGALAAASSHVNGPMVKRNQANGFPVVRFISPTGPGAAIKFQTITGPPTSATVFIVARLDLASTSAAGTYQHLWQMGAAAADVKGVAVSKDGKVLVGKIGVNPPAPLADSAVASGGTINPGSWHIYALDVTAAHHKAFVDGTANTPLDNSATAFADLTHANAAYADGVYQIGNDEADIAHGALQGDIAEVRCAACIQSASVASSPFCVPPNVLFPVYLVQSGPL